ELAQTIAGWSKDPSTQVGAVVVSPDRSEISLGYNGFPRRMRDDAFLYQDRQTKYSRVVHGEINAILQARGKVAGHCLFTWPMLPCDRCAPVVINAGIRRVVSFAPPKDQLSRWEKS